jgi:hypothetical protein
MVEIYQPLPSFRRWAAREALPLRTVTNILASAYEHSMVLWDSSLVHHRACDKGDCPLLFMFASVSLVLSSMQVALSVPSDALWSQRAEGSRLRGMRQAFWVFSISVLLFAGVIWVLLLGIPPVVLAWQLLWGFQKRNKKGRATSTPNVQVVWWFKILEKKMPTVSWKDEADLITCIASATKGNWSLGLVTQKFIVEISF